MKWNEIDALPHGEVTIKKSDKPPTLVELDKGAIWQTKETLFTGVFPPGEEPSPLIVDACRKIDPGFLVVWCWKVMTTPANTEERLGHYVICRHVPSTTIKFLGGKTPIKLSVVDQKFPSQFSADSIYEVESWTRKWPKGSYGAKLGLPDEPKPFDERVIAYVQAQEWIHKNVRLQEALEALKDIFKEDEKALQKTVEDAEYELKQYWAEMKKCVEEGRMLPPVFEKAPFTEAPKTVFQETIKNADTATT